MVLPSIDWKSLTDQEISEIIDAAASERTRRETIAAIPNMMESLNNELLEAKGVAPEDEWAAPEGAVGSYPKGWKVLRNGKTWESLVPFNTWEPGISGWREVVIEGKIPAWLQPTGAHDAYQVGVRVSHKSKIWTNSTASNVWEPGVYGWVETK